MAKTKVSEYDSTAANNTDIDSINIAEGMAPSNVNNAIRQLMAHLKIEFFKTGSDNISLGDTALDSLDGSSPGSSNTAIGSGALTANTTASNNTAVGKDAGKSVTTGVQNTILGSLAGDALIGGNTNVAIGVSALGADTQGNSSVAIGSSALRLQNHTSATDAYNVAIGRAAGENVTTAVKNTIIGSLAGDVLTTGGNNVVVGYSAMGGATTASLSTVVGYQAGEGITTGERNNLFGVNAGQGLTTGSSNTFIGGASTGSGNGAGKAVTTGSKNTILGTYDGNQAGLDIRTSSNNIVLSDGDGNPRGYYHGGLTSPKWVFDNPTSGQVAMQIINSGSPSPFGVSILFQNAAPDNNTQYFIDCSDNSGTRARIESDGDFQSADNSFGSLSDEKLKENIADASSQWDDIKAVRVRKYSMKEHNSDVANRIGVIAQELEAAGMSGLVKDCPDLTQEGDNITEADTSTKAVKYSILYMKAIKALQEAMTRIETLETEVAALKG